MENLSYLYTDPLHHADMIDFITRQHVPVLYAAPDGVVAGEDGFFQASCETQACADRIAPLLASADEVVAHQSFLLARLPELVPQITCHQAVYQKTEEIPYALPEDYSIRTLDASHLPFVYAHYDVVHDLDYLGWRIENGMYGVFYRDEIAGFIGTHGEGSMGMLEILPAHRRRGLAFCLEAHLINRLLEEGRTPYCQIEIHNDASLALQHRLGLTVSDRELTWMKRP